MFRLLTAGNNGNRLVQSSSIRLLHTLPTQRFMESTRTDMDIDAVINTRKNSMSPTYGVFQTFKDPVVLESAKGQYCYGPGGKRYLDLLASNLTISVGHAHPKVVAAAKTQIDKAPHLSSMYYSESVSKLTDKLLATFPERTDGEKWKVKYAVTGTEAVEIALMMVRVCTGNLPVLSLTNSYHGSYGTAMGASGSSACRFDLPEVGSILHLQAPINEHRVNVNGLIDQAEATINSSTSGKIAGWLFETLQGYGGIHVLPNSYIRKMADLTKRSGGYVIADEIQTGFGRMGEKFWAYEMSGIEPDIVIVAKGLGCGFPISAIVAKESVFDKFAETGKFIFRANPVSAAAACAVLDVIKEEGIQDHAKNMGQVVSKHLNNVLNNYEACIEVRGRGLMWGIEFEPSIARSIFEDLKDRNFLVGLGGAQKNVLRVMPPMCIKETDLDDFADALVKSCKRHSIQRFAGASS